MRDSDDGADDTEPVGRWGHSLPWLPEPAPESITYGYFVLPPADECVMGCGTKLGDQPAGPVCDTCALRAVAWLDTW